MSSQSLSPLVCYARHAPTVIHVSKPAADNAIYGHTPIPVISAHEWPLPDQAIPHLGHCRPKSAYHLRVESLGTTSTNPEADTTTRWFPRRSTAWAAFSLCSYVGLLSEREHGADAPFAGIRVPFVVMTKIWLSSGPKQLSLQISGIPRD
jgi:hypothetical protein